MSANHRFARLLLNTACLAVLLGAGLGPSGRASAQGQLIWNTDSWYNDNTIPGPGGTSEDTHVHSDQTSSDGRSIHDDQTRHKNEDGSSEEHEQIDIDNPDGDPNFDKGRIKNDWVTDKDGNRKFHHEEIIRKNGKCRKYTLDITYDRAGKVIDRKESTKDIPCALHSLEIHWEGQLSGGNVNMQWGPNTGTAALVKTGKTYQGAYHGVWSGSVSGGCTGGGTFPVDIAAQAEEDEFGDLDFTVRVTEGSLVVLACAAGSGSASPPPTTDSYTFTLPDKDGARNTVDEQGGATHLTFTLRLEDFSS